MLQQLDVIKDRILPMISNQYVLFSRALFVFASVFADLCYDHVYRQGAELHTTSWSTINRQFM